mgnify:CR=1 FL=1
MSITVRLDEGTALDILMERVRYWTDDNDTLELFEKYYENAIWGGCFDGSDFNIMSIVDNDYVNNTTIVTRAEYESNRNDFLRDNIRKFINNNKMYYEDEDYVQDLKDFINDLKEQAPEFDELECGSNDFDSNLLSGSCILTKTEESLLMEA